MKSKAVSKDDYPLLNRQERVKIKTIENRISFLAGRPDLEKNHYILSEISALQWALEFIRHPKTARKKSLLSFVCLGIKKALSPKTSK